MRKQAVVATLIALVIAVAVPAAFADSPSGITPANGNDYILPDGTVYQQNDDGTFSWIPNVATGERDGPRLEQPPAGRRARRLGRRTVPVRPRPVERVVQPDRHLGSRAPARSKVTPANGWDYVLDNGQVWQDNFDGTCSWIPDVADR